MNILTFIAVLYGLYLTFTLGFIIFEMVLNV